MTANCQRVIPHRGTSLPAATKAASEVSQFVKPFGGTQFLGPPGVNQGQHDPVGEAQTLVAAGAASA